MNSIKRLNKLADSIERKISKYAQDVQISSTEMGAQSALLFNNDTNRQKFEAELNKLCNASIRNFYMKHNGCGIEAKVWIDIKVQSINNGRLIPNAYVEIFPTDQTPASSLSQQMRRELIENVKVAYNSTMQTTLANRQNDLNAKKMFHQNAQKIEPEQVYTFAVDKDESAI